MPVCALTSCLLHPSHHPLTRCSRFHHTFPPHTRTPNKPIQATSLPYAHVTFVQRAHLLNASNQPLNQPFQPPGVIAFNTDGYLKTALHPRREWVPVDAWKDKPGSGLYVHNSILWKLLVAR